MTEKKNEDNIYISCNPITEYGGEEIKEDEENEIDKSKKISQDMLDDIIHEIAHSLEEVYSAEIYADQNMESEFLGKRIRLQGILDSHDHDTSAHDFKQTDYSAGLDEFFYKEIGYPLMTSLTSGLFYSPYAATSLREYFANGFEAYFYHRDEYLSKVSPILYQKIEELERDDQN